VINNCAKDLIVLFLLFDYLSYFTETSLFTRKFSWGRPPGACYSKCWVACNM